MQCSDCGKTIGSRGRLCKTCYMREYYKKNESYRKYRIAYAKEYIKNNPEKVKEYGKVNRERYKEYHYLRVKKWRQENPGAHNAQVAVYRKLRAHRPESCEICGKKCKPEAHHPDYSKPLLVIWCCPSCHYWNFNPRSKEVRQNATI